jgi:vacuolar-type H+-ATPase subunit F/Vma7
MPGIVFIGDELNSAGFGLAGVSTRSPAATDLAAEFAQALARASLVVLTRRSADCLEPGVIERALARDTPLVVVLPDITEPLADTGCARRIRSVLGISS